MNKFFLFIIILLLVGVSVSAWTPSTNADFLNYYALYNVTNATVEDFIYIDNSYVCTASNAFCNQTNNITGNGITNMVSVWSNSSSLGTGVIFDNGTHVGIGFKSPTQILSINGSILADNGGISVTGNTSAESGLQITKQGDHGRIQTYAGFNLSLNPLGNNVGIGTSYPAEVLDINGNIKVLGYVNINDSLACTAKNAYCNLTYFPFVHSVQSLDSFIIVVNSTTSTFSWNTTAGDIRYVVGTEADLNVNQSVYWDGETSQADLNVNYSTLSGTASVLNWTSLQNYPAACSAGSFVTTIDDTITCVEPTNNITGNGIDDMVSVWFNSSHLSTGSIFDNGTHVGIGFTNPSQVLSVNGSILADQGLSISGNTSAESGLQLTKQGDHGRIQTYAGFNLSLNPLGNNVGIGTSTPSKILDVNGDVIVSGNLTMDDSSILISEEYKLCLDGATCTHYIYYNSTHTVIT